VTAPRAAPPALTIRLAQPIVEDDEKRAEQDIQKLTDRFIAQVDELLAKKTTELMEV